MSSEVLHHDIELMKPSKKATRYYTKEIEELQKQLALLSLRDLLGDKDYADWIVLKEKLGQRPLMLRDKDMHALELLVFGQHSVSPRLGKLEHLMQVIHFINSYQVVRAYEKIFDKVMERIDVINSTMTEWLTSKKGEPGAKDECFVLNEQKIQLQQELSYLTTRTKKFINLNPDEKLTKLPAIMDCLSEEEKTVLIKLSSEIDALRVLSQYPQAHYLNVSLPGPLGHHLDEMDKAFIEINKHARPRLDTEEAHHLRPQRK